MKIKIKKKSYSEVAAIPPMDRIVPKKPSIPLRALIRVASIPDLLFSRFSFTSEGLEKIKNEPCLILMNHSSFIDLEIAYRIFFPRPLCIVSTHDGLVGKKWLMRQIGCIPTKKIVSDPGLISDMRYALNELGASVLMFPEAGYSFDGRTTTLPKGLGLLAKRLGVPVVSVITDGAFMRQPLYNELKKRRVKVTAHVKLLLTDDDYKTKRVAELDDVINAEFSFDAFKSQRDNGVRISERNRADGLHRILYKCPACKAEGVTVGKGTSLVCGGCGKTYELDEYGVLCSVDGSTEFTHVPDWYDWQRSEVKNELERGEYRLDAEVDVYVLTDYKALYRVGEGRLVHDSDGFRLTGCDGELDYSQSPLSSYSLNSDYYWYEIGDVIGIGDSERLYYCFPKGKVSVAKARLAAEELYKIRFAEKRRVRI